MRLHLLSCCSLLLTASAARADVNWIQPKSEELRMTADAKAPGAAAIVLSYDELDDADSAEVTLHVRIKVLTSAGVSAGTIELPRSIVENDTFDQQVFARTIHADGSVVPFVRTKRDTFVSDDANKRVLSMPSVEAGSILEYICHFQSQETLISRLTGYYFPRWNAQGQYFIRSEHFALTVPSEWTSDTLHWVATLPENSAPTFRKARVELALQDVPAAPSEELMPPKSSAVYNVRFFYYSGKRDNYWAESGGRVDEVWSPFYKPTKTLTTAMQELAPATATEEQRLRAIYAEIMTFENTDFTRQRSATEEKRNGERSAQNSDDLFRRRRGDSEQLALLFVAMARSAGFEAYPMAVTSRDRAVFSQEYLGWSQLDSVLAIVKANGHEVFFDPGERYLAFAHVSPRHSNVLGVSVEDKLVKIRYTPTESFNASRIERVADLKMSASGAIAGTLKIGWIGTAALDIRHRTLRTDTAEERQQLEEEISSSVPPGVTVKLISLTGLEVTETPVVASFNVAGSLGTATSKRVIVPSQFFQTNAKAVFTSAARTLPVNFPGAYRTKDTLVLHLDPALTPEALPNEQSFSMKGDASAYVTNTQLGNDGGQADAKQLLTQRIFVLNKVDYTPTEYTGLREYFAKIATNDAESMSLQINHGAGAVK